MSNYYRAKAESNANITVYKTCIVFNATAFNLSIMYGDKVLIEIVESGFIMKFGDAGCNINVAGKRLNLGKTIQKLNLPLGKFELTEIDKESKTWFVNTERTVKKYQNKGQGIKGGKLKQELVDKDDEWYERNTPDMYDIPNH